MQCICSGKYLPVHCLHFIIILASTLKIFCNYTYPLITAYVFHVSLLGSDRNSGSVRVSADSVRFGFGKNSWFGRFLVCVRKRPKFRFGSGFGWFWPVRFGKKNRRYGSVRVRQKFLVRSFPNLYMYIVHWLHFTLMFTCTLFTFYTYVYLYIVYILHVCLPVQCTLFTFYTYVYLYIVYILHVCLPVRCLHFTRMFTCTLFTFYTHVYLYIVYILHVCLPVHYSRDLYNWVNT